MEDTHPIGSGVLLKVATEWDLPIVDLGAWIYRSKVTKNSPSRTDQGHWDLGCSCLSDCLVVVVVVLTWKFLWTLRTKLSSLIDSSQRLVYVLQIVQEQFVH